jgi:ketosteroid isomerase-like protein
MNMEEWVEAYGRPWRERDADSAVGLFTEDADYRVSPFREPVVGSKAIHAYWEGVTSVQEEVAVSMGTPFLRFAVDGRCTALREYWFQKPGRRDPHPGWGE